MLIDDFLPDYQFAKRHETCIRADPSTVFGALCALDLSQSPVIGLLFRLRGLPNTALRLESLHESGFVLLGQQQDREIVLGLVGRFWKPSGDIQRIDAAEFQSFSNPRYAKAAWNFYLEKTANGATRLRTQTRIYCLGQSGYRFFRFYWLFVGPFSAWTRREMLRLVRREAEKDAENTQ